ncbi:MAG: tRNA uridine-5-carboxymethylaminomethyl(34) synthesis GTPase MnmE [Clostridia bacterium]|nr:tRNA uridine-5-carboxymethylaminomethyl(34) synthesis GTPase MnmE [Clostridia bacterium]
MLRRDTIAAVSTPPGKGGVALLRVSGPEAFSVASAVFLPKNKRSLADQPARRAVYGEILCAGGMRDSGIAVLYPAPASFTGEDVAEICCHGGVLVQRTVLRALFAAGARPAEPGEFSRRALLNGKMDLCEAEAFADLLEAKTEGQLKLALSGTAGKLKRELDGIAGRLADAAAALCAKIDYPDEDLAGLSPAELAGVLEDARGRVARLIDGYERSAPVREGVPAVICGLPNAGKSSLYNALAGEELAIVTDTAGTTRDVLTTDLAVGDVLLRISDTAGLREGADEIERIGVGRALAAVESAALVLFVIDRSRPLGADCLALADRLSRAGGTVLPVFTKCDLPAAADPAPIEALFPRTLTLSARTGEGLCELKKTVEELFLSGAAPGEEASLAGERQYAAALAARTALENARAAHAAGMPEDCVLADVEEAIAALGELDGRGVSEEIVSRVFSRFCVGK